MPGSAAKCFKSDSNQFKSSTDNTNKMRSKTIYQGAKNQNPNVNTGPIHVDTGGFLGAIGGFNTSPYDLLLDVAKGKAYSESQCIKITDQNSQQEQNIIINPTNETCTNSISKCGPLNQTYELFEGTILKTTESSSTCLLQPEYVYDPSTININIHPTSHNIVSKIVNADKLGNINLHNKMRLTCPPQL